MRGNVFDVEEGRNKEEADDEENVDVGCCPADDWGLVPCDVDVDEDESVILVIVPLMSRRAHNDLDG